MEPLIIISNVLVLGIILLLTGTGLLYWVGRRIFNRTNAAGTEVFASFEHKHIARFSEKLIRLTGWLFILTGLFFIAVEWFNHRSAEKYRKQKEGVAVHISAERM